MRASLTSCVRLSSLASLALLALACDPTQSDTLRGQASVLIFSPAGDAPAGRFGEVLVSYEAELEGRFVSRYAVAGGASAMGPAFFVFFGFDDQGMGPRATFPGGARFAGCDTVGECPEGTGGALAAFPEWRSATGTTLHACLAAPSTVTGQFQVRCEDRSTVFEPLMGPGGQEFGASAVGLPRGSPLGVALFGAPAADGQRGALYRLPNGSTPVPVDISSASVPGGARFGSGLQAARLDDRTALVAVWAPGDPLSGDTPRVVVLSIRVDVSDVVTVTPRACLEGGEGFGAAIALGDIDGDSVPDLAVGYAAGPTSPQRVDMWSGAALPASAACGATQPMPVTSVACSEVEDPAVPCGTAGNLAFGSAIALGDIDGDSALDLVVGAPAAPTGGRGGAGAVFVVGNTTGGFFPNRSDAGRHALLTHSMQREGNELGFRVATIRGAGRSEIVATAPGARQVVVFACGGITGDRPGDVPGGPRTCLPPGT